MAMLEQAEGGTPVSELCREHGMSSASFYKWRAKFDDMDASLIAEMEDMAEQNRRIKKMYAEMSMQNVKWSCFLGQVCGLAKMHLVSVHAALRVSALPKYAMSGVRLSRAV